MTSPAPQKGEVVSLLETVKDVREEWGLDARGLDRLLTALVTEASTVGDLVRSARIPRRDVEAVLARTATWLDDSDGRYWLRDDALPDTGLNGLLAPAPTEAAVAAARSLVEAAVSGLPPSVRHLDHVPATVDTIIDRAVLLTSRYHFAGATLLCVGDHDLTSLAVTALEPRARALVVDIDQRLIGYLAEAAREHDLPVTLTVADLRLGLPPSLAGAADLAFTDPPYTPEGIRLFVSRALQGLIRSGRERVALAYGFSPHQLAKGFRTQSELHELRLVTEAVLPAFNAFEGAEAIGTVADLYLLRPTRWTWPVVDRPDATAARIYTRGAGAVEASPSALPPDVSRTVDELAAPEAPRVLVGEDWPAEAPGTRRRLADHLNEVSTGASGTVVVALHPHYGASLTAALLRALDADITILLAPARDAIADAGRRRPARRLVDPLLDVSWHREGGDGAPAILVARRRTEALSDPASRVLRWLSTHQQAAVGNAWREGLARLARDVGASLTKNEARSMIRDSSVPSDVLGLRLEELPRDDLGLLIDRVVESAAQVAGSAGQAPGSAGPAPAERPGT